MAESNTHSWMPRSVVEFLDSVQSRSPTANMVQSNEAVKEVLSRQEVKHTLWRLLEVCLGLTATVIGVYISAKVMRNAMDPTKKEKNEAQKRVGIFGRILS